MTWQVRPGRAPELPVLPDIERAAATLFPPGRVPDPNAAHGVGELQGYLDKGLLWVASEGNQLMGYVIARELEGALHVFELAVEPRFGRRGIGTALMQRAMAEAERRGYPTVTLTTFEDLPWNAPFYRRLGFRVLSGSALSEPLRRLLEIEEALGMSRRVAMAFRVEGAP